MLSAISNPEDALEKSLPIVLHAGPLAMDFLDGALRYVRWGDEEVIRRIYVAVRDKDWGTVPGSFENPRCDVRQDSFVILLSCRHREGEIDFVWTGRIEGTREGTIVFSMDGSAMSSFRKNRIGICVLHPMDLAGRGCTVTYANGSRWSGEFPRLIAPEQPVRGFTNIAKIEYGLPEGVVSIGFSGEWFEMEDQRNWTDASFKVFSTPLHQPFPVRVERGHEVRQQVNVAIRTTAVAPRALAPDLVVVTVDRQSDKPLPQFGLGSASHGEDLTCDELTLLRRLHLSHLRVDLEMGGSTWEESLKRASREANAIDAGLEAALFVDAKTPVDALSSFREQWARTGCSLRRILLYPSTRKVMSAARDLIRIQDSRVEIGGGTNAYFAQLNEERPDGNLMDCIAWSIHPQEHAFDNDSLVETLPAQAETIRSARALYPAHRLVVSPITLRKRFNPYAEPAISIPVPGQLPEQVDPRQSLVFAAGWAMGSVKYLSEAGAASLTYFETSGWRGLFERSTGSPLPLRFPSWPGQIFPVYYFFEMLAGLHAPVVRESRSSRPLAVESLAIGHTEGDRLLLANFTPENQRVSINGLGGRWIMYAGNDSMEASLKTDSFLKEVGTGDGTQFLLPHQSFCVLDFS